MSVEAHKCNKKGCQGFVVFENADFDFHNIPSSKGVYEFASPSCTECGKEFKVIPHYIVIDTEEDGSFDVLSSACITEFERRRQWLKVENETDPLAKVEAFIAYRGYTYDAAAIIENYKDKQKGYYISHTAKDCVTELEKELKLLVSMGH